MVALALVFGGSAAVGVNYMVQNPPNPKGDVVPVVVAAMEVPRGASLTAEQIKTREFAKDQVPPDAITKVEDAVDRAVFIPLTKDDLVLNAKLAPKGSGRGMSAMVPKGMRAFTIHTPSIASGVAGFVLPGNKVDVLLTINDLSGLSPSPLLTPPILGGGMVDPFRPPVTGGGSTTTLLQNVEILAVDQKVQAPAENKVDANQLRSVTLLVTPQQANMLDLGQNKGTLHLALRNMEDKADSRTHPATLADLQFRTEPPWDQKAMGLLAALGKALAQRRPAPAAAPGPQKAPELPTAFIRTIRAGREGGVLVQLPEAPLPVTKLGQ
jgi:pilus assembly protein CpaB